MQSYQKEVAALFLLKFCTNHRHVEREGMAYTEALIQIIYTIEFTVTQYNYIIRCIALNASFSYYILCTFYRQFHFVFNRANLYAQI